MSPSTAKACRAWWEIRGHQGTVRRGYRPSLRPDAPGSELPNEAAVYVLCVPIPARHRAQKIAIGTRRDCSTPLTRPLTGNAPRTSTTRDGGEGQEHEGARLTPRAHCRRHADVLRTGPGQTISEARASWMARGYVRAGWTPADLAFAIAHHPVDGRYRHSVMDVTRPGAWLFWRLSRWLDDPDGAWRHYCATGQLGKFTPIASAGQRAAAAAAADAERRARQAAERAERAELASSPTEAWRAARAELANPTRRH